MINKINLQFIVLFCLSGILAACKTEDDGDSVPVPQTENTAFPNTIIGSDCDPSLTAQNIKFIHLADLHGRFGFGERKYEKLRKFYENARAEQEYTLFTNAGDDYEKGTVAELLSAGAAVREAVFAMEFDARTLGNHDFAWGVNELSLFTQDPHATVFASNTQYIADTDNKLATHGYAEFTVGCVTVGMFGMVSEPWNELDQQYVGDFLPEVSNDWRLIEIAEDIVKKHRNNVDVLVMLSHLGVGADLNIAANVNGIDLVLGGHSHQGVSYQQVNDSLVIQPKFYAEGLSEIDIRYDLKTKRIAEITHTSHLTKDMNDYSLRLAEKLDDIIQRFGPTIHNEVAYSEYGQDKSGIANITANSAMQLLLVDAVLIDEELVWKLWSAGALTSQRLNNAYRVERQKSNTPGFNSIYTATVTGDMLLAMQSSQPTWVNKMPENIHSEQDYRIALHKNVALNPELFFGGNVVLADVAFRSETWELLKQYGEQRTQQCLFVDTNNPLYQCIDSHFVLWSFSHALTPLTADLGNGVIHYRDTNNTGWGDLLNEFSSTSTFAISPLPDGDATVMKFAQTSPEQGYQVQHNLPGNGEFQQKNKLSNYTLVLDLYWQSKELQWAALLQTSLENNDDADLFVHEQLDKGVGLSSYVGSLDVNQWYRIAFVINAASQHGTIDIYIDGVFQGQLDNINERWALAEYFYLLTDDNNQTAAGYLNSVLLIDKPLTAREIETLGVASVNIDVSLLP